MTEQERLARLYNAVAEGGGDGRAVAELESVIRDRPDLQDQYARLVRTELLLRCEMGLGEVTRGAQTIGPVDRTDDSAYLGRRNLMFLATAIALLVAVGFGGWIAYPSVGVSAGVSTGALTPDGLLVRDTKTLNGLWVLNPTGAPSSLLLPIGAQDSSGFSLCSGTVWMNFTPRRRERGHLVTLAPGQSMKVSIDAHASCQNALGVIELDVQGRMIGRAMSFANVEDGGQSADTRLVSSIGRFSEINVSEAPRYFLFSGSYRSAGAAADAPWLPSDYLLLTPSASLQVLGWDDSSYTEPVSGATPVEADPDRDFNDIRMVIHFSGAPAPTAVGVRLPADPPADEGFVELTGDEYGVDVRPGEEVLLLLTHSSPEPFVVRLVDAADGRVVWANRSSGESRICDSQDVRSIRNPTEAVKRYALTCHTTTAADGDAAVVVKRPHIVVAEDFDRRSIGFEDGDEDHVHWVGDDIMVDVYRFLDQD